jgi:FtsH-binding integral membrane protein
MYAEEDGSGAVASSSTYKPIGEMESTLRQQFARKVFGQVSLLLLLTAVISAAALQSSAATQQYLQVQGAWILWFATVVAFGTIFLHFCYPHWYTHVPQKYVLLMVFGSSIGTLCMYATLQYQVYSVCLVASLTISTTVVLCLYASMTKRDCTDMGAALCVGLWLLIALGILQFFFRDRILQLVSAIGGTLLFSLYIIYDMQLILGGKHRKHQFELDDDVVRRPARRGWPQCSALTIPIPLFLARVCVRRSLPPCVCFSTLSICSSVCWTCLETDVNRKKTRQYKTFFVSTQVTIR